MDKENNCNRIELCGIVGGEPRTSHENHRILYQQFPLEVRRLSGAADRLNVVAPEETLRRLDLRAGEQVGLSGEVRSFNNRSGSGNRLVITVFTRQVERREGEHQNSLELSGTICKEPVQRSTPMGRKICDLMLAVNRRYGRADYLPCIAWGALANLCGGMGVGDRLHLEGRLQSRKYTKQTESGPEDRVAYEVSVMNLLPEEDSGAE